MATRRPRDGIGKEPEPYERAAHRAGEMIPARKLAALLVRFCSLSGASFAAAGVRAAVLRAPGAAAAWDHPGPAVPAAQPVRESAARLEEARARSLVLPACTRSCRAPQDAVPGVKLIEMSSATPHATSPPRGRDPRRVSPSVRSWARRPRPQMDPVARGAGFRWLRAATAPLRRRERHLLAHQHAASPPPRAWPSTRDRRRDVGDAEPAPGLLPEGTAARRTRGR